MTRLNVPRWTTEDADVPAELAQWLRSARDEVGAPSEVAELGRRLATLLGPASGLPGSEKVPSGSTPDADTAGDPAPSAGAPNTAAPNPPAPGAGPVPAAAGHGAAWLWAGIGAVALGALGAGWSLLEDAPSEAPSPTPALVNPPAPPLPAPAPAPAPEPVELPPAVAPAPVAEPPSAPPPRAERQARPLRQQSLAEAALLRRAQSVLARDPGAALALTRDHQRRFRHGALAEEREVIAIDALRRLGRHEEASARAARFERRYRGSVHLPRLEAAPHSASDD